MKAMVELAFTVWKLCDMVNKHVGSKLDINEITWKVHRGNVIQKMSADSVVDFVEKAQDSA